MTQNERTIEYITHYMEHENRTSDDKNEEHKREQKETHRQEHDIS